MKDDFITDEKDKRVRRQPGYFDATPGSLITMSSEANDLCELCAGSSVETDVRSANFDQPQGCRAKNLLLPKGPRLPPDAVYVGRETKDRRTGQILFPGVLFANDARISIDRFRDYSAGGCSIPASPRW